MELDIRLPILIILDMPKVTIKHWKTGVEKTIEYLPVDVHVDPRRDILVVWNVDEDKMEDIRRDTIVEWIEDDV